MAKRRDPSVLRLVVAFLRSYAGMSQTELGKASGIDQGDISRYESGQKAPSEESLRRMAAAAGLPWSLVTQLRRFYSAVLGAAGRSQTQPDLVPIDAEVLETVLLSLSPHLIEDGEGEAVKTPVEERREAAEIWSALEGVLAWKRKRLLELSPHCSWALAERVCEESVKAAAHQPSSALELANLAIFIAEQIPGEQEQRSRVLGFCWAHIANARRVGNDFVGADEAFDKAWEFWRAGASADRDLLPEGRLLDLEASLRRAERRFTEALDLLQRARATSGENPLMCARVLLKKEHVFDQMGDTQKAIAALEEAAPFVEASGDPRLLFALQFKVVNNLYHQGRHKEAADRLPEVEALAAQQNNELDLLRVAWLGARVAAGLGQSEEAITGLERVCRDFKARQLAYDAALSSLDLTVLYLEQGKTSEVKALVREMAPIFQSQGIHREALVALRLFASAVEQEVASAELARRIITYLERARQNPELRFEARI